MKLKFFFTLCVMAGLLSACQEKPKGYVINGLVTNQQEGMVYLKAFRNKMFFNVDSTTLENGAFTFKGQTDQPLLYALATDKMNSSLSFFLGNATLNIQMDTQGDVFQIANSPVNDLFLGYAEKVHQQGFSIRDFVKANAASPVAAFYLYRFFTYQLSLDELKAVRADLSPSLNTCPYVIDLDGIIKQLENVEIGKTAPDFTLPNMEGVQVSLSDFRGKYVLLDFWASWCPPCRRENPNVVKLFNEYKDKNFTIIGISLDYSRDSWLKGIDDDGLTWTHVSDLKYWDSEIPALYGVRGIPSNMLLDPNGVILAKNVMGEDLANALKQYIK